MKIAMPSVICIIRFNYIVLIVNIKKRSCCQSNLLTWLRIFNAQVINLDMKSVFYYFPKSRISGDETCLYNTNTMAPVGDENSVVFLKYLTSIELSRCPEFYASHPIPYVVSAKGCFLSPYHLFPVILSAGSADF